LYEPSQVKFKKAMDEIESITRTSKLDEKKESEDSDYSGD
jgi:hypothetical protein